MRHEYSGAVPDCPAGVPQDEQHLLRRQFRQNNRKKETVKPKSKLSQLRYRSYIATFFTWFASVVVLGISAQSVSEDELSGTWLVALVYNLSCGAIGTVTPILLCPRSMTNAMPSIRTLFVLVVSTVLWLGQLVMLIALHVTTKVFKPYKELRYASIALGVVALLALLLQWFLVYKIWRGPFTSTQIAAAYEKSARMYWETSADKEAVPIMGTSGRGRNRIREIIHRNKTFGLLRALLTVVDIGIAAAAIGHGRGRYSSKMHAVFAFTLVTACLHIPVFTCSLSPRSKTDPRPTWYKLATLSFSTVLWIVAVTSIFFITLTSDPLGSEHPLTKRRRLKPPPPLLDNELRLLLHGHGIAAGCIGMLSLLCTISQWYCVLKLYTGRFTPEEKLDAYDKTFFFLRDWKKKKAHNPEQDQQLASLRTST